jgi:hypothetical protein
MAGNPGYRKVDQAMTLTANSQTPKTRIGIAFTALMVVVVIGGIALAAQYFNLQEPLRGALAWIAGIGPLGLLISIALYVLACVLLLPGSILTLGGGAVFGLVQGFLAVSIGATLGATCAFPVGRYLARNWVAKRIAGNATFKAPTRPLAGRGGRSSCWPACPQFFPSTWGFLQSHAAYPLCQGASLEADGLAKIVQRVFENVAGSACRD